jgi:alkanesulfonate monooxygenase SsuD/methylene tetrahydromethanopterin reductase-like flavin-dependent oxidoreductase (luciferase family)
MHAKMRRSKRLFVFKTHNEQLDDEITDDILDQLVICGSVNKVVDNLLALRQEAGDFGEIVYAGMDWADPGLAKRSIQLMAEEVMPRVNAAIGASAAK